MPDATLAGVGVVVVNNFPGPGMGGGEVLTLAIVDALAAAGAEVKTLVPSGSLFGEALVARGRTRIEASLALTRLPAALRAIRAAAGNGAVLFGTGYFSNLLVRRAARANDRVVNLVAVMPSAAGGSGLAKAVRRLAERATIARTDAFAASAGPIAAELRALGAPAGRITVIPNAIDTAAVRAAGERPLPEGFPASGPVVGCVARLETVKGVEYLIRAMAHVPGATLALAGIGSLDAPLRSLAASLGVADRVRFLGWVRDSVPVLRASTVVALPSLAEGLPLVALEAMALGRPVVATAVGGTPDAIEDGVTGRLVPPADPRSLAAALRELLDDPARAAALAEAGRRRVDERFDLAKMGPAYVELIARVARAH